MDRVSLHSAADAAALPGEFAARAPMEQLIEVVGQLSLARSSQAVIEIVRRAARQLTGADGATFVLREGGHCHYIDEDAIAPLWKGQRFPLRACISGWVMLHRQAVVIEDIYADARVPAEAYRPTFVRSLAMVPIRTWDPIGALGNYWAHTHCASAEQLRLLQMLADTAAVALENVRVYGELEQRVRDRTQALEQANRQLQRLSITDELTGLHNRRGLFLLGEQELRAARRAYTGGWLLFADVDHLKDVNDSLGHDAGDELIVGAGQVLAHIARQSDIVARIGGDEFVVFTIGAEDGPIKIRERLRAEIERYNAQQPHDRALSMSVGITRCDPFKGFGLRELIEQADSMMYEEKRARRSAP